MRIAQTPAPKKDRIYGSKLNKPNSASSKSKAKSIKLSESVITSIKSIIEGTGISLATAKAVVRRGMGAYSKSHRPTIKGGKPNSRVAWGLARLNAFVYKAEHGKSKSGKYVQDDDLLRESGFNVNKYHLGGDMSKHLAPNGKPSNLTHEQYKLVRTPAFKKWFGDWENSPETASKVVDEETKEPLVVYHGTNNQFTIFNRSIETNYRGKFEILVENVDVDSETFKKIQEYNEEKGSMSAFTEFWFSNINWMPESRYVMACFLNCKKLYVDENGQGGQGAYNSYYGDGLKITNADGQNGVDYYVVSNSNQIKLADGTNTTFDGSNPDIRYKDGGTTDDFDWESLFNPSEEEQENIRQEIKKSEEQEKEDWYQNSRFSKKWAATYQDAINKTVKEYLDAEATYDDWSSRQYKSNKGTVFLGGDDIFGEQRSIGSINEGRRKRVLRGSKMLMDESIETLKELGLNNEEITNLIEPKDKYENGGQTFYERTYADGTKKRFSVDEYEKNIYPYLPLGNGGNVDIAEWETKEPELFKCLLTIRDLVEANATVKDSFVDTHNNLYVIKYEDSNPYFDSIITETCKTLAECKDYLEVGEVEVTDMFVLVPLVKNPDIRYAEGGQVNLNAFNKKMKTELKKSDYEHRETLDEKRKLITFLYSMEYYSKNNIIPLAEPDDETSIYWQSILINDKNYIISIHLYFHDFSNRLKITEANIDFYDED